MRWPIAEAALASDRPMHGEGSAFDMSVPMRELIAALGGRASQLQ